MAGSPQSSLSLNRASTWLVAGGAACACVAVAAADPEERQLTPSCPFRVATGWWCPFCGATRSVSRAVRGDVGAAVRYNLLLVAAVAMVGIAVAVGASPWGARARRLIGANSSRLWWSSLVAVVAFTVIRNTAGFDAYLRYPGA